MRRLLLLLVFLIQVSCISSAPATPLTFNPSQLPMIIQANGEAWTIESVSCAAFPGIIFFLPPPACPYLGYTLTDIHKIYILRGLSPELERETVLHELMHVSIGVVRSEEPATMHEAIYAISIPLAKILIKNPQLLDYFNVKK